MIRAMWLERLDSSFIVCFLSLATSRVLMYVLDVRRVRVCVCVRACDCACTYLCALLSTLLIIHILFNLLPSDFKIAICAAN